MPGLRDLLSDATSILTTPSGPRVERTIAAELKGTFCPQAGVIESPGLNAPERVVRVGVVSDPGLTASVREGLDGKRGWALVRVRPGAGLEILASAPHLLFHIYSFATEDWIDRPVGEFSGGVIRRPSFPRLRPSYDSFLTQHNRTVRGLDREEHIRNLARLGFSHAEVNALAFAVPFERGPEGEVLHRFYTYCAALDQFVASRLNRGVYDQDYVQANLNLLKKHANLAEKYGMASGLTCFEPRSVPDALLQKYPMLRGARVDHPIRSWHPRFNLSIAHPVVQEHYAEMMENLVREVPQLEFIAIWSNDSGAGFEYTSSLYVGRNGGGYVIREWKGDTEIAEAAANNLIRFQKILRDAGRKVNPKFRTLTRLEAFTAEHGPLWNQLQDGIDVEVSTLLSRGWDVDYMHPRYPERRVAAGTALFNTFDAKERVRIDELRSKGSDADVWFWPGGVWNHEPLIGIPFPRLVYEKLKALASQGVTTAAFSGGTTPRSFAPYNINEEVVRAFQADRDMDPDAVILDRARAWIGDGLASDLVKVWARCEETYRGFPVPVQIYSGWGVWYRLLVRPIIPDIEKISEKDRRYYEQFLLAPPHNRCRVDFRYDVGFDLVTPQDAMACLKLIDANVVPAAADTLRLAEELKRKATTDTERAVAVDLYDRMLALRCWYRTQRNVTAWIAGVHTYLESTDSSVRKDCRRILKEMVLDEIDNARALLSLWESSTTRWMIVSDVGETTFIYYENFGDLLRRKIELMQGHEDDAPYVDPDFQWRVPGVNWTPQE
jgi:hypothetical protein